MKMSKSMFFVLVLSVVSFLMLSSAVTANQPTVSIQVPAGITSGVPFVVTVTAQDTGASPTFPFTPHVISSLSLAVSGSGWSVTSPASVSCGTQSCTQTFAVTPPSSVGFGMANSAILTVAATSSAGETFQQSAVATITSAGSSGSGHLSVQFSSIPTTVVAGQSFTVTAIASDSVGHAVTDLSLASSRSAWSVSRVSNACSLSLSSSCTQSFIVTVPSSESIGAASDFTATASTNAAETAVSGAFRVTVSNVLSGGTSFVAGGMIPINEATLRVEVDGSLLAEGATSTIRQLERGETFDVKVSLEAIANVKDVEINVFVTGFDSRTGQMTDSVRPFDLGAKENTVKRLSLKLPDRAAEDKYKLRVVISDRFSEPIVKNYNIKIQPSDTRILISDFELSPEESVQAGRAILATVRVKNLGDSKEDDVKIKVSIPELGVSATSDFIDDLEPEESTTSEEFFLRIGSCARPGIYDVVAEVTFDNGDEKVTSKKPLTVTRGACDAADEAGQTQVSGKTTVAYSAEAQSAVAGGSAASYPITITNSGASTKAFVLSVDRADWADFQVSPSNLVTVKAGSTQTVYVLASAKAGTQAGERVFTVSVKDSSDTVLQTLALKANVVSSASGAAPGIKSALTIGLVVIVAILVLVGLILAFRRVKGGEEGESQTYY